MDTIPQHHYPGPSQIPPTSVPILNPSMPFEDLVGLSLYRLCPSDVAIRIQILHSGSFGYYIMVGFEAKLYSLLCSVNVKYDVEGREGVDSMRGRLYIRIFNQR